jgi:hypothetical protein
MGGWWQRDVIDAGKLPLVLCLVAFVLTFLVTRTITRLIRAGRGPFRNVTTGGVHLHHDVPGLIVLIIGAFTAVGTTVEPWRAVAGVLVGMGVSLVLDEFALILHLTDDYWTAQGRLSVDAVSLTAACLGLALVGFSPVGVEGVGPAELAVRISGTAALIGHGVLLLVCILKGKFGLAVLGLLLPVVALIGAVCLARPDSTWARRRYDPHRQQAAARRAAALDGRWGPLLHWWQNLIGGAPTPTDTTVG